MHSTLYQLDHVDLTLDSTPLLQDVSLTLPAGQMTGLIGHNGSGKSSLLRLLARLQAPSAGEIRCNGQRLDTLTAQAFARQVAYLPQNTPATDGLMVRELVALGRYPWHGALGRFSAEDAAQVEQAMMQTDVVRYADRLVDSLSGGERQRVWLAMLLAQQTQCLLLDEPTSALDISHQLEVLGLVRELCRQRAMSAVVVLHDVNMASRFCDYLVALRHGTVLLQDTPAAIMQPEQLQAIYGVPMRVLTDPANGLALGYPA